MTWLRAACGVLAILGAGFAVLRAARAREGAAPAAADAALAWLLGCGVLTWVLFVWGGAGGHGRSLAAFALPPAALFGAYELLLRLRRVPLASFARPRPHHAALFLLGVGFALVLVIAGSEPMLHYDERFNWAYKAKIIFYEGGVFNDAFLDPERYHRWRGYPLLVPHVEAIVAWAVGTFDERAIKLVFPVFFFALVALFGSELRDRIGTTPAAFSALFLAALPAFAVRRVEEGGSFFSGFADLPLAAFALAAVLLLQRFRSTGRRSDLLLSAACLAMAVLTKRDGRIFLAAMGAITGVLALRRELGLRGLALYWLIAAGFLAPFARFTALLPPDPNPDASYLALLDPAVAWRNLSAGLVLRRYLERLASPDWGCVGVLLPLSILLALAGGRAAALRREWPVLVLGLAPFAVYLVAFHVSPFDPTWHMDVSLDRLQSQFVPLWAFCCAVFLFSGPRAAPAVQGVPG